MADEVVGSVQVEVHGDTDPLKRDIRRAATDAGQALDTALAESTGTAITDNIVGQINDAEEPAKKAGRKTGRALVGGLNVGIKDGRRDTDAVFSEYQRDLDRAGTELGEMFYEASVKPFQRIREFFAGDEGSIDLGGANITGGDRAGRRVANDMKKSMLQAGVEKVFLGIALKAATIGPLFAAGIRAAAPLVVGLTGQVAVLGTALAGLGAAGAGAFATMIPAVGALKIAFSGMDAEAAAALKEKFTGAIGDLAGFKERVRNEITPALVEATKTISKLAPEINKLGLDSAKAGGRVAKAFASMLVGRREEIANIFGNAPVIMERFGNSGSRAFSAILNALDALQPLVMRTVNAIATGMDKMSAALNRSVESGKFTETMNQWYDRGVVLMQIFRNLGTVIGNFFGAAADSSDSFLTSFEKVTQEWADWTESLTGQYTIKKMFDDAVPVIEEVWGLLGDIAGLFTESFTGDTGGLVEFIQSIRQDVIPGIEAFQKMLRESGIQDALYDFGKAILGLFTAGGGSSFRAFIGTLTTFVEVIADLTDVLGPVLVPLATFYGTFKALAIGKAAFSGLFALPAMLTGLVSPAKKATTALEDVGDAVEGTTGTVGRSSGFGRMLGGLGNVLKGLGTGATVAFVAAQTAGAIFNKTIEDTGLSVDKLTESMKDGHSTADALNNFKFDDFGGADQVRESLDEIIHDLTLLSDDSWRGKVVRFDKDVLGVDVASLDTSKEALDTVFESIQQYALQTGDFAGAATNLKVIEDRLRGGNVEASLYEDALKNTKDAIQAVTDAEFEAGRGANNFNANFGKDSKEATKNVQAIADSLTTMFTPETQEKLTALFDVDKYVNKRTGALNKAGQAERRKIILEADVDSVNGVDEAIDDATEKKIRNVLLNPQFVDENGQPNAAGRLEIATLLIKGLEIQDDALAEAQAKMDEFFKQPIGVSIAPTYEIPDTGKLPPAIRSLVETGRFAVKAFIEGVSLGDIPRDVEALFGQGIIAKRIELEAKYKGDPEAREKIEAELRAFAPEILAQISLIEAESDIEAFMGEHWEITLGAYMDPGDVIEVDDQLLKMTEEGIWEVIVGTEAETARAEGEIYRMVRQADGTFIKVKVTEDGTAQDTQDEIDDTIPGNKDVWVNIKPKFIRVKALNGEWHDVPSLLAHPDLLKAANQIVLPPTAPEEGGGPGMISPGGPTTMGFMDSFGPRAGGRANLISGPGVMGSPNYWTSKGDKEARNVTINNYYPEPERASETIAMSMRVARYA